MIGIAGYGRLPLLLSSMSESVMVGYTPTLEWSISCWWPKKGDVILVFSGERLVTIFQ